MPTNNFANTNWVCMEILRLLLNQLVIAEQFSKDFEREFNREFAVGSTVTVKLPQRFLTSDGMAYNPQGLNRVTTTVNLDQWVQIAFEWDDYERAVKLERSEAELKRNYYDPAAEAFFQEFENRAAKFAYQNASMTTGVLGTSPTSVSSYFTARQRLEENACGSGRRYMAISSDMMTSLGTNITTVFNPVDEITKNFKDGAIGRLARFTFFESQSLYSHTAGTWAGSVTVSGAGQSGTSLVITATAGDTFNVGDKFSINNVNLVNPMTRRVPGKAYNKVFTITQALTAAGGAGADTINFLPAIYGPGSQYQNVDALPASGASLTLWPGTSSPNGKVGTVGLGLSDRAFALVGAKLYLPNAVESKGQAVDPDSGLSVRKVKVWDGYRSVLIQRMDSLFGMGNLYQDNCAVCVAGA